MKKNYLKPNDNWQYPSVKVRAIDPYTRSLSSKGANIVGGSRPYVWIDAGSGAGVVTIEPKALKRLYEQLVHAEKTDWRKMRSKRKASKA